MSCQLWQGAWYTGGLTLRRLYWKDVGLKIWLDGNLVPQEEAAINVLDHGVLYGDGCFEGIRVYNGRVFKLQSHLDRMFDSARRILWYPSSSGAYAQRSSESGFARTSGNLVFLWGRVASTSIN